MQFYTKFWELLMNSYTNYDNNRLISVIVVTQETQAKVNAVKNSGSRIADPARVVR